jgi:hypothetical protein
MPNNLYRVTRNEDIDYDEWSMFIVAAPDEHTARRVHPSARISPKWDEADQCWYFRGVTGYDHGWTTSIDGLEVVLLGTAADNIPSLTVICASFHAG